MLSRYEKETIITFNDEEMKANIYTCNTALQNKLLKLCKESPLDYRLINEDETSKTFETFKDLVKFRKRKILTPEQKKEYAKRFNKVNV